MGPLDIELYSLCVITYMCYLVPYLKEEHFRLYQIFQILLFETFIFLGLVVCLYMFDEKSKPVNIKHKYL